MILNLVNDYIPDLVIPNEYFFTNYGIPEQDIFSKSGIKQRRRTLPVENTNSIGIEAVKRTFCDLSFPVNEIDLRIGATYTTGLGHNGRSIDAVYARPRDGGIKMPLGRDVFQYACKYMVQETEQILKKNCIPLDKLNYFIPHQANARITDFVAKKLNLKPSQVLTNIEQLGNTGSASTPIVLSQNWKRFSKNDMIVISVFGGGYSSGAILLKKL
jgi:3-oxoacyl-[acyl-carrier-protein] synthase III